MLRLDYRSLSHRGFDGTPTQNVTLTVPRESHGQNARMGDLSTEINRKPVAFFQGKPGDELDFPTVYYCAAGSRCPSPRSSTEISGARIAPPIPLGKGKRLRAQKVSPPVRVWRRYRRGCGEASGTVATWLKSDIVPYRIRSAMMLILVCNLGFKPRCGPLLPVGGRPLKAAIRARAADSSRRLSSSLADMLAIS